MNKTRDDYTAAFLVAEATADNVIRLSKSSVEQGYSDESVSLWANAEYEYEKAEAAASKAAHRHAIHLYRQMFDNYSAGKDRRAARLKEVLGYTLHPA